MAFNNLIGQTLGHFQLVGIIGEGGMAMVYKGFDARLERHVAIKVIRSEGQVSEDFLKRFEREARAMAQLSHPNIVKVYEYGEERGLPYLVMEYLPGGTLKTVMGGTPMPYQEAAGLVLPIARALAFAHKRNVVHRDIKPTNIMFSESGVPMLTDFGIAKLMQDEDGSHLTRTGYGIGTPDYMAPEQGMGKNVDHRVDIYSLGVVFYELLTGNKPFKADTPMGVVLKHISEPLPLPGLLVHGLPQEVDQFIQITLAKIPEERFSTTDQFADAMEALMRGITGYSRPAAQGEPRPAPIKTDWPSLTSFPSLPSIPGGPYEVLATSKTPALVIYVIDVSSSMNSLLDGRKRIDVVSDALYAAIQQMVFRSTKGMRVSPRYKLGIYAYSDRVYDLLGGVKTVDYVAGFGIPELSTMRSTDTAAAFQYVEKTLQHEILNMIDCPAPLVCHMTDGEYTGDDPQPFVDRIKALRNNDGNILVENIFISDKVLTETIPNPRAWGGINPRTPLNSEYAQRLRDMSSFLPESYRTMMHEAGYNIKTGSVMMLPGMTRELVEMGFVMSSATPVSRSK
jgi:serine/threonine protein kinase